MAQLKEDMFAKIMGSCLESKKAVGKKSTSKKIVEGKKKTTAKKRVVETRSRLHEDEDEYIDDTIDDIDDEVVDNVVDDIAIVVDPDLDADELADVADDLQDIIDDTPEGEVPFTDEYIGDLAYTCPICANTFFADHEMTDGEECPVCGDYPDAYVIVGEVEEPDNEEYEDELEPAEEPEEYEESLTPAEPRRTKRVSKFVPSKYKLDESTFNPFMTKFIKENYKNAKAFKITGASIKGCKLTLECRVVFKSGRGKSVKMVAEHFHPVMNKKFRLPVSDRDNFFKVESRRVAPIVFEARMIRGNIIKCEGMKYKFTTKYENKKLEVSGKLIRESKGRK